MLRLESPPSTDCVEKLSEPLLLVIFELAAHGRRNNDSHGVETANYYYLKVHRKYLSTSFSTQSVETGPSSMLGPGQIDAPKLQRWV